MLRFELCSTLPTTLWPTLSLTLLRVFEKTPLNELSDGLSDELSEEVSISD